MKKECVVITGGAGVIGSHLADYFIKQDYEVIIVDDLSGGSIDNIPAAGKIYFYQLDVRDESITRIYQRHRPGLLFHLAARYANELSIDDPVADLSVNAGGTIIQLQLALKNKVKRFIYASSSCVYEPSDRPLREDSPIMPHTPYAISKLAGEQYCQFYSKNYGLPVTILRYFNSYGGREKGNKYRGVVPRFITSVLQGCPLIITGTGQEKRDFTYVDDTVKGTVLAAFSEKGVNEVFNIGTGKATAINELAQIITGLIDNKVSIEYSEMRSWDKTIVRAADIKKAATLLGYVPQYDLQKGLNETIEWYRKNPAFINKYDKE